MTETEKRTHRVYTPHRPFVKMSIPQNTKRLYFDRFGIAVEPAFFKKCLKSLANRDFCKKTDKKRTPILIPVVSKSLSGYINKLQKRHHCEKSVST